MMFDDLPEMVLLWCGLMVVFCAPIAAAFGLGWLIDVL